MKSYLPLWAATASLLASWSYFTFGTLNVAEDAIKGFIIQSFCYRFKLKSVSTATVTMLWSICASCAYFGAILGSGLIGLTMERFGRKEASMSVNGGLCVLGSSFCFLSRYANSYEMFFMGIFISGINWGHLPSVVIYMVECAADQNRGFIGSISTVMIYVTHLFGSLIAQPGLLGNVSCWQYLYVFGIIAGGASIGMRCILHESPKFAFIKQRNEQKARQALRFYQKADHQVIQTQLDEYVREDNLTKQLPSVSWRQIFWEPHLRRSFFLSFMTIFGMDFSGIDLAWMYSTTILESLGLDSAIAATVTAAIFLIGFLVMIPFCFYGVESIGRRNPMIIAFLVCFVGNCLLTTGNSYASVLGLVFIVLAHHCVLTQVAHFIPAEVCSQSVRSKITAVSWMANWSFAAVIVLFFDLIYESIYSFVYLFFAVISLCITVWFWKYLPETKQKPVDTIVSHITNNPLEDNHFILDTNDQSNYGSI